MKAKKCRHCRGELHLETFDGDSIMLICEDCGETAGVHDTYTRLTRRVSRDDEFPRSINRDNFRRKGKY